MKNLVRKLSNKLGIGLSLILSQAIVLLFDIILMGIAIAVHDYGNKLLFIYCFALGLLNKLMVKLVKRFV